VGGPLGHRDQPLPRPFVGDAGRLEAALVLEPADGGAGRVVVPAGGELGEPGELEEPRLELADLLAPVTGTVRRAGRVCSAVAAVGRAEGSAAVADEASWTLSARPAPYAATDIPPTVRTVTNRVRSAFISSPFDPRKVFQFHDRDAESVYLVACFR
jgi:hypothetical protein